MVYPVRGGVERTLARSTMHVTDRAVDDRPHLRRTRRRNRRRVVPEIETIHVLVGQPQANLMWMVDALARPRLQRKAAGYDHARRRPDRKEHRLPDLARPDVGRERRAIYEDVNALLRIMAHQLHARGRRALCAAGIEWRGDQCEDDERQRDGRPVRPARERYVRHAKWFSEKSAHC